MADYISWLRRRVGHEPVFANATAAIILNDAGAVLLQRRGGGEAPNSWSFPGGLMEIGERVREALVREVSEETGLNVEVQKFVGVYSSPCLVSYPNGDKCHMITQVFECKVVGGSLRADDDETLELRYFPMTKRPKLFRSHIEQALQDFEAGRFGMAS